MTNFKNIANQDAEVVEIVCADGQLLCGHFLRASPVASGLPVLLSPATGVKQHFYLRFARWLADQGHNVLVFDYRGIGLSLRGPLANCRATLAEWGQLDQVAAVDWLVARTGVPKVVLIGHSAGGQMIGLLPNHEKVARLVGVSASTGWLKGMRLAFSMKARLGLLLLVPLGIRLKGYAPTSALGLGENLPSEVGRQWGQWCAAGGYATNAVRRLPEEDFHASVRTPLTLLYADDDDIATPSTVSDLLRTLPHAPSEVVQVNPRAYGLDALGHLNWFRQSHQSIWRLIASAVRGEELQLRQ
ncbi:alpha/beta hydrolase family protein [Ottowia thiooxydans]|uniref:alpha/beta hydrolase family protein n=1 Tax=Ottowia thiooxydans TaxID=219182 RepID=UPI000407501A|nr:alpha/beta fold hydrolase [Ottowia thiooxydans]